MQIRIEQVHSVLDTRRSLDKARHPQPGRRLRVNELLMHQSLGKSCGSISCERWTYTRHRQEQPESRFQTANALRQRLQSVTQVMQHRLLEMRTNVMSWTHSWTRALTWHIPPGECASRPKLKHQACSDALGPPGGGLLDAFLLEHVLRRNSVGIFLEPRNLQIAPDSPAQTAYARSPSGHLLQRAVQQSRRRWRPHRVDSLMIPLVPTHMAVAAALISPCCSRKPFCQYYRLLCF